MDCSLKIFETFICVLLPGGLLTKILWPVNVWLRNAATYVFAKWHIPWRKVCIRSESEHFKNLRWHHPSPTPRLISVLYRIRHAMIIFGVGNRWINFIRVFSTECAALVQYRLCSQAPIHWCHFMRASTYSIFNPTLKAGRKINPTTLKETRLIQQSKSMHG